MAPERVLIVGAGVAGLRAASILAGAQLQVTVFDEADRIGGRVVTDQLDDFLLDRGFQLLNPAYPQARNALDLAALELATFEPGVVVTDGSAQLRLADPLRRPARAPEALFLRVGSLKSRLRLGLFLAKLRFGDPRRLRIPPEVDGVTWLREQGIDDQLIDEILRPFLAGVLLESELGTSAGVVALLLRSFLTGIPALPANGMGAIPAQLASHLPADALRLGCSISRVTNHSVELANGEVVEAEHVIVAVPAQRVAGLVPAAPQRQTRGTTTWWFSSDEPLATGATLVADRIGKVLVNSVEVSAAAPSYAPRGKHLVAASGLGVHRENDALAGVTKRLAELHRRSPQSFELLKIDALHDALPFLPPPWTALPPIAYDGILLAGDHVASPSLQGAMASGARAARAVLARLQN